MKKSLWKIFATLCACFTVAGTITACDNVLGGGKDPSSENLDITAVYNEYVLYVQAEGKEPLSYEEWLETIKGKDGKDGLDGKSAYDIWLENGHKGTEADFLAWLKGQDGKDGVDGEDGKDGQDGKDGVDGKSAYELYCEAHPEYTGTLEDWLASLKGEDGKDGVDGEDGKDGQDGKDGVDGKSAYELYCEAHPEYTGTLEDWLASLKGEDGKDGVDGEDGKDGQDGKDGVDGKSAYELYCEAHPEYTGTLEDWLASLKGEDGKDGVDGEDGKDGQDGKDGVDGKSAYELYCEAHPEYTGTLEDWLASLKGEDGKDGVDGEDGKDGQDGVDGEDGKDGKDGQDGKDGVDGKSAYELYCEAHPEYTGTLEDWLASLKGEDGKDGVDGEDGKDGQDGKDGVDGKSAYELYCEAHPEYTGTLEDWLASLKGEDGKDGVDGEDGKDGQDGVDGEDGKDGKDGQDGKDGVDGKSAYELYCEAHPEYTGTLEDWLASLKGEAGKDGVDGEDGKDGQDGKDGVDGKSAYEIWLENGHEGTEADFLAWLKGQDGKDGVDGEDGKDGVDGEDGRGISFIEYNEDGDLVIHFTDGTTQTVEMPKKEEHVHTFGDWTAYNGATTAPCVEQLMYRICSDCATIEWKNGEVSNHSFINYVSNGDATCVADGTKTAHCEFGCGATDTIIEENSKIDEHVFTSYVSNDDATCQADGTKTALCDNGCGTTDTITDEGTKKSEHSFTSYVSDKNSDYQVDGTKTAHCDYGCGAEDTIIDEGSALNYTKGLSFAKNGNGYQVTSYSGNAQHVIIPVTYKGLPVTSIKANAFTWDRKKFKSVFIPNSVLSMGHWVFFDALGDDWDFVVYCEAISQPSGWDEDWRLVNNVTGERAPVVWGATIEQALCSHVYTAYVSNNNATCEKDGTETAVCDNGCQLTNTKTIKGTKLGHSFTNYVSNGNLTSTAVCDNGCGKTDTVDDDTAYTEGLVFTLNDTQDAYSVIDYTGSATEVYIPATYEGLPVTSIGDDAFNYYTSYYTCLISSVTISEGVTNIGKYAFASCDGLTEVVIPNSVTSIGNCAFQNCKNLQKISIPASATDIGYGLFTECESLTNIQVNANNTAYKSVDGNFYTKDGTELIKYAVGKTNTSFTVPDGVTTISASAFGHAKYLNTVVIPASVTSIANNAFEACKSLTDIQVDENNATYKSIDGNLYSKDGTILLRYAIAKEETSFVVPDHVTTIDVGAFNGFAHEVENLTQVVFGENSQLSVIKGYAFRQCDGLTEIVFPASLTEIGAWSFMGCEGLVEITIPKSVKKIGQEAFRGCDNLTTIYCEASSQPSGWVTIWNYNAESSSYYSVVWGCDSESAECEHNFTNYVSNNDATCQEDGTKTALCDYGCGAQDMVTNVGSKLNHVFTNYVSNGDATESADGTKTAHCDYGCGTTDTVMDEGSKLPAPSIGDDSNKKPEYDDDNWTDFYE